MAPFLALDLAQMDISCWKERLLYLVLRLVGAPWQERREAAEVAEVDAEDVSVEMRDMSEKHARSPSARVAVSVSELSQRMLATSEARAQQSPPPPVPAATKKAPTAKPQVGAQVKVRASDAGHYEKTSVARMVGPRRGLVAVRDSPLRRDSVHAIASAAPTLKFVLNCLSKVLVR